MKRQNYILSILLILFISPTIFSSCTKNLDINQNPNKPTDVSENLILPALLSNFSYEVNGGYPTRVSVLWTKYLAGGISESHEGNYFIRSSDVNNFWTSFSYSDVMNNAIVLKNKALANGNPNYAAIAKVVLAWNLSMTTDVFGDVPYAEAFQGGDGIFKPKYDKQEDGYKSIQTLLDEAIAEAGLTANNIKPGADDFLYQGDMSKWINLAHTLKARFYLRLSNAPGMTASTQAKLALDELAKGSITMVTQPKFAYIANTGKENPWFQYTIDGKWAITTRPSQFYVNKLIVSNDPRINFQVSKVTADENVNPVNIGKFIGLTNEAPSNNIRNYSAIAPFYSAKDAPLYWMVYPEVEFIKAEAEFLVANKTVTATVKTAYEKAIRSSMDFYGIVGSEADTYIMDNVLNSNATIAYSQIMNQKYIANFLMFEAYNDFRRTRLPSLPINDEMYPGQTKLDQPPRINSIPVRFPYPSGERLYNSANIPADIPTDPLQAIVIPVWWNSNK